MADSNDFGANLPSIIAISANPIRILGRSKWI